VLPRATFWGNTKKQLGETIVKKTNKFEEASINAALDQVLSEYPDNMTAEKILKGIGENEDINVWEPFEDWSNEDVCKQIKDLACAFRAFAIHAKGRGLI